MHLFCFPSFQRRLKDGIQGFSLVELSIVLVILGLLVGGILAGRSLIRAAELRGVASDFTRIHTAVMSYRGKYFALPGDHNEAFRFFDTACAATADLCNGNGDLVVNDNNPDLAQYQEAYRAVQHLALAGLIEGSYTGVRSSPAIIGRNLIPSQLKNAGYWFFSWTEAAYFTSGSGGPSGNKTNWIHLGAPITGNSWNYGPAGLSPEEAWNIDTKLDDGKPGRGRVFGSSRARLCSENNTMLLANYNLSATHKDCSLGYKF